MIDFHHVGLEVANLNQMCNNIGNQELISILFKHDQTFQDLYHLLSSGSINIGG